MSRGADETPDPGGDPAMENPECCGEWEDLGQTEDRWTPSRLHGTLPVFIALYKINCSTELGFMAIPSQFSYTCIFIVAVSRHIEKMDRLKCLMKSLKCQPEVFDCLTAKDNWISLFESILNNCKRRRKSGYCLGPSSQSLHIHQWHFPSHESLQVWLNSWYLKIIFAKGINSLLSFLPLCFFVHLPGR